MGEWSKLPGDILDAIGKRLIYYDYIRFCAVCVQWKSLLPKRPKLPVCQIPWLMLPFNEESETHCSFYSVLEKKVYPLELPQARGKLYRGSSNGWLVIIENGPELKLLNPLTSVQIDLPPITAFPYVEQYVADRHGQEYAIIDVRERNPSIYYFERNHIQNYFIWKVVLSSSHMSSNCNDYTAVAIFGEFCGLAFCKHGDKQWTASPTPLSCFCDAIFHEDKFFAITSGGRLFGSRIDSLPKVDIIPVQRPKFYAGNNLHLVGTSSGLMMVETRIKSWPLHIPGYGKACGYATSKFKIYRLDTSKPRKRWSKVKSLGDHILFLGCNSAVLIPSQKFSELKSNCIYFADDNLECHNQGFIGGFDIGVFNMEDGSVKRLPGYTGDKLLVWPPPVWVVPGSC